MNSRISIIKNFILKGDYFINIISTSYPLPESLIEKYKDLWSWGGTEGESFFRKGLSGNESLPWKFEFIDLYNNYWNWGQLSNNPCVPTIFINKENENLKEKFFLKYSGKVDWYNVAKRDDIDWSLDFISLYDKHYKLEYISSNTSIPWSLKLIDNFIDKWDWKDLSKNESIPWSIEFIDKHKDKWDWESLSKNKSIPFSISILKYFEQHWNWDTLSSSTDINWSINIINVNST